MRCRLLLLFLLGGSVSVLGALPPLVSKDISLMLRSGYSNPTVMQELSLRHFADMLDVDKESMLLKAGASDDLLNALKAGAYTVSPEEVAAAREKLARPGGSIRGQPARAPHTDLPVAASAVNGLPSGTASPGAMNALYESVKGDLVRFDNGAIVHATDEAFASKKLIALYFSAHWCGPCRKFTPELVDFYNRVTPQHPEFEIIFVSYDRSPQDMQGYMGEARMPWPAIAYDKIPTKDAIKKYSGTGIPCLVLIDSTGKVLSNSFAGTQYLGPKKVLADIDAMLASGPGSHIALTR